MPSSSEPELRKPESDAEGRRTDTNVDTGKEQQHDSETGYEQTHLSLASLNKRFGQTVAVDEVSLDVSQGEFVSLLGPSGCGKTTTLRMVAGFLEPTSGEILVDGHNMTALPPYKRNMGMVFQSYALFPHMSVSKNVAFGLEMRRLERAAVNDRVRRALERVHLEDYADRRISELSGGQQQRVALARALVIEPSVLLLDEPLSNLDKNLRDTLRKEIRELQQEFGITTLFVTHDQDEALTMSDRIVVMNEGRVEQMGTPEDVYERPATPFVAAFIGKANFVEAELTHVPEHSDDATANSSEAEGRTADSPDNTPSSNRARLEDGTEVDINPSAEDLQVGSRVVLLVRPHRIELSPSDDDAERDALRATVRTVTYLGESVQYEVEVGSRTVLVERPVLKGASQKSVYLAKVGEQVSLSWDASDALVFEHDPEQFERVQEERLRLTSSDDEVSEAS